MPSNSEADTCRLPPYREAGRLDRAADLASSTRSPPLLSSRARQAPRTGGRRRAKRRKRTPTRAAEIEASRFCANVAPSVAEARIAWQTKRLGELDAQVKQRLADLEKAEASMQEWVAKRDALLKAASDDLVAIYAKMQPENAAVQLSAMDDQMAAAILGKLKPSAAGAILDEMEAERASKLASFLSGASGGEKKS